MIEALAKLHTAPLSYLQSPKYPSTLASAFLGAVVKELKLSYYDGETPLFGVYPDHGNLI